MDFNELDKEIRNTEKLIEKGERQVRFWDRIIFFCLGCICAFMWEFVGDVRAHLKEGDIITKPELTKTENSDD